jgi:hypothetical protein
MAGIFLLAQLTLVDLLKGQSVVSNRICVTGQLQADGTEFELPGEWRTWPTRIELAFDLSTGGAVTADDYSRFQANSLQEVVRFLFDPTFSRRSLRYSLKADGFLPAYRYDSEWSLLRRGSTGGVRRRVPEQRAEPWSSGADTTLFEIWRRPITMHTFKSRIWLRAGGRTEKDSVRNWIAIAQQMRQYRGGFI